MAAVSVTPHHPPGHREVFSYLAISGRTRSRLNRPHHLERQVDADVGRVVRDLRIERVRAGGVAERQANGHRQREVGGAVGAEATTGRGVMVGKRCGWWWGFRSECLVRRGSGLLVDGQVLG